MQRYSQQLYSEWVYSILLEYACASCLACTMPVRIHINRSMPESVLSSVKGFSANAYVTGSLHCLVSHTLQHSSTCALLSMLTKEILQQTVGARLRDWLCSVLDFSTPSVPNPPSHQVLLVSSSGIFLANNAVFPNQFTTSLVLRVNDLMVQHSVFIM